MELSLEQRFPQVQPQPLNDELPQPWASVPGEVPAEEQSQATKCTACGVELTGSEYYFKNGERSCWYSVKGNAYCKKCYPTASEELLNTIEGQPMPAEELPLDALKCKICGKTITDDDVHLSGEEPYCWDHYPMDEAAPVEAPQAETPTEPQTELPIEPAAEVKPPVKRELSEVLQETLQAMNYSEDYIRKVYETAVLELGKIEDKIASWQEKRFVKKELIAEIEEHFSFVKVARENLDAFTQLQLGLVFDEEPAPVTADPPVEPEVCAEIAEAAPAEELSESEKALTELISALGGESEEDAPF